MMRIFFAYSRKNEEKTMIVVCNFFDKEIPMPLAKECEGMEVLISNYKDTSDMSVLRPFMRPGCIYDR